MNRITVALAVVALATSVALASPELKVTAREAGIAAPGAAVETQPAPATATSAEGKFVVVSTISVGGVPLMQMKFKRAPFDDIDACKAFIVSGDEKLKKSNDGLTALAKIKIHPEAVVGMSCEPSDE